MVFPPGDSTMNFPTSTYVGRLYVESRHLPATQGGGGDIHDVMATPFGVRLLVGDVMGPGLPANRTGLSVLNAWRDLACTEPSLAGIAVRLHALIARSGHPERFVTALLVNFPVESGGEDAPAAGPLLAPGGDDPPEPPRPLDRAGLLRAPAAAAAARRFGGVHRAVRRTSSRAAGPVRGVVPGEHDPGRRRRPVAAVYRRRLRGQGRGRRVLPAGSGHRGHGPRHRT